MTEVEIQRQWVEWHEAWEARGRPTATRPTLTYEENFLEDGTSNITLVEISFSEDSDFLGISNGGVDAGTNKRHLGDASSGISAHR